MKRVLILIGLGILATAPAADAKGTGANTFSGECHFEGLVRFSPPLTSDNGPTRGSARAAGPCSGTFTARGGRTHALDGERLEYVASNSGSMSCTGGLAEGSGYLRYGRHKLRFSLTETRAAPVAHLALEGRRGGGGNGIASVSAEEDPLEIARKCAGPGLEQVRIDIDLETPGISG